MAALLTHHLGRAAEPRDELSHGVCRGPAQPATGRPRDAPGPGRCTRRARKRRWIYVVARRSVLRSAAGQPVLLSAATGLAVVKTRRVANPIQSNRIKV